MSPCAAAAPNEGARARPRALVFAFACEPGRGSEPGAGWGVGRAVAEFADCVVLVGSEHMSAIRAWSRDPRNDNPRFIEVPEMSWPVRWRGPLTRFLLYFDWMARARRAAERLHAMEPFDVVQHVTYSVYWLPTPATRIGPPCVWGPVGGAATTPLGLLPLLGVRGMLLDLVERLAVRCFAALPVTRLTWRDATVRVLQNEATRRQLPAPLRAGARTLNHALFTEVPHTEPQPRGAYVLFFGALESRKGGRLAIRALAHTPDSVRLVVAGDGPEMTSLVRLAAALKVESRVEFLGRVPRTRGLELLAGAAAAVFTGLREEGGLALAEALLCGTPVIVVANGGALTIAQAATDPSCVALIEPADVDTTARRVGAAMTRFTAQPVQSSQPLLDRAAARRSLRDAYDEALAAPLVGGRAKGVNVASGPG